MRKALTEGNTHGRKFRIHVYTIYLEIFISFDVFLLMLSQTRTILCIIYSLGFLFYVSGCHGLFYIW